MHRTKILTVTSVLGIYNEIYEKNQNDILDLHLEYNAKNEKIFYKID